jgi:MerR family transcriptional regulator, light-induced transcriptional regulator
MTRYRSGVAARLTGIPVQTLRVWERRYNLTDAKRPGSRQRLYGPQDIERLACIKQLVDLGHPIGSLAGLDLAALASMQESLGALSTGARRWHQAANAAVLRLGFVGQSLQQVRLEGTSASPPLCQSVWAQSLSALRDNGNGQALSLDVLFVELPSLLDASVEVLFDFVQTTPVRHLMVFYRFAPSAVIRRLRARGFSVMRMPPDEAELREACERYLRQVLEVPPDNALPVSVLEPKAHRYATDDLLRLTRIQSSVFCECPRQLAQLLLSVASFEEYSAQCASRDSSDALMHRRLQSDAAVVRSVLEESLARLLAYESIDLASLSVREPAQKNS